MSVNNPNPTGDWRLREALELIRQCQTCPSCGANICTARGVTLHKTWHANVDNKVGDIDSSFQVIDEYVRGEGGLEDRIIAEFQAIRSEATTAISTLRNETTTAISQDRARLGVVETEITRPTTGIRARLAALEALGLN